MVNEKPKHGGLNELLSQLGESIERIAEASKLGDSRTNVKPIRGILAKELELDKPIEHYIGKAVKQIPLEDREFHPNEGHYLAPRHDIIKHLTTELGSVDRAIAVTNAYSRKYGHDNGWVYVLHSHTELQ